MPCLRANYSNAEDRLAHGAYCLGIMLVIYPLMWVGQISLDLTISFN